jgi:hypothetical protein
MCSNIADEDKLLTLHRKKKLLFSATTQVPPSDIWEH